MATRKPRKFNEGGISESENSGIDSETRNRAMASVQPGMMEKEPEENFKPTPKAKAPIVTKEELAKSGLTLREYMNQKQGLKPRGGSTSEAAPAKTEATPKKSNILEDAKENVRRGNAARASMAEASRPKVAAGSLPKKGAGLSALSGMKKGGSVKGWGQARGARKAKMY